MRRALLTLTAPIGLYLLGALILSFVPANLDFEGQTSPTPYSVYLRSNGVHVDIVVPTVTEVMDWPQFLSGEQVFGPYPYLALGWGEKEFYLKTKRWADLEFKTAVVALLLPSPTVMHVTGIRARPREYEINLTRGEYETLVDNIKPYFADDRRPVCCPYFKNRDLFFTARGSYHLFFTCNTWTAHVLKTSGIRSSVWTPFSFGPLVHH